MIHKKGFIIAQTILFFLLATLMLSAFNTVFTPKWSDEYKSGSNIRGFYDMPRGSVDVLVLGSSNVICGVDANRMYADHGISAYSCGTEAQPILGSYAWLREALRFHDLQAVVLDVANVFAHSDEASYRKSFDYMRLSPVKWEALRRYQSINPDMSFGSYLLPFITYHSRWNELTAEDWNGPEDLALRGFYIRPEVRGLPFPGFDPDEAAEPYPIPQDNLAVFLDIIALCRQEGLELILVESPSIDFDAASHRAIQDIADEHGLAFLDFNIPDLWPNIDHAAHMADFKHFNVHGAAAATDYICRELQSRCDLPDRRGDDYLDGLDAVYAVELDRVLLQSHKEAHTYLEALDNEHYAVLMASDPDKFAAADESLIQSLAALGMKTVLNDGDALAYAGAFAAGSALSEQRGPAPLSLSGSLPDGSTYTVTAAENSVSIRINGVEYAPDRPGLNLVVWDLRCGEAVDALAINAGLPSLPLTRTGPGPAAPPGEDCTDEDCAAPYC